MLDWILSTIPNPNILNVISQISKNAILLKIAKFQTKQFLFETQKWGLKYIELRNQIQHLEFVQMMP